ncbi:MAG: PrsW family intramembrane metalloprotease [Bacteroidales bacterium]|nr:PrsW family intramembrane metalloprotease [Bacteroidales bacterium]
MMSFEPILILLIAPVIAIIYLSISNKNAERGNHVVLRNSFYLGILSFLPSILLIFLLDSVGLATTRSFNRTLFFAFAVVGLMEELPKFVVLRFYSYYNKAYNSPIRGILYSIAISLGFVLAKNAYFIFTNGGLHFSQFGGFLSVPFHILFAIIMGFFISIGKFKYSFFIFPVLGLGAAAFFHGFYQFALFTEDNSVLYISAGLTLIIAVLLFRQAMRTQRDDIDHIRRDELNDELKGKN